MKIKAAKAKGRRCSVEVQELLYRYAPDLKPGDILATCSSETGCDVKLSPAAKEVYPLAIECKNVERIQLWEALKQAESHAEADPGSIPTLFFRRNRSKLYVALPAEAFLKLVR